MCVTQNSTTECTSPVYARERKHKKRNAFFRHPAKKGFFLSRATVSCTKNHRRRRTRRHSPSRDSSTTTTTTTAHLHTIIRTAQHAFTLDYVYIYTSIYHARPTEMYRKPPKPELIFDDLFFHRNGVASSRFLFYAYHVCTHLARL